MFLLLAKEVIAKAAKIAPKLILEIFKKSVKNQQEMNFNEFKIAIGKIAEAYFKQKKVLH